MLPKVVLVQLLQLGRLHSIVLQLLHRVGLRNLPHHRELGLTLPSDHPFIVILALLEVSQVKVLDSNVVVGRHLSLEAVYEPSNSQLDLKAL